VQECEGVSERGVEEMVRMERGGEITRLHPLHKHQVHKTGHAHQGNVKGRGAVIIIIIIWTVWCQVTLFSSLQ
jgi:hypothetical protein